VNVLLARLESPPAELETPVACALLPNADAFAAVA
jgi:hypothetical protein